MAIRSVKKAVIPVAGLGTRMLPATKAQRKEMLPIAGKPLIQYSVEEAARSGIETVILVTGERSDSLLEHFSRDIALEELLERQGKSKEAELVRSLPELVSFCTVEQPVARGLGDAIFHAQALIGEEPFAVLLPDVIIDSVNPCTQQLINCHQESGSVIATRLIKQSELDRHGVVAPAEEDANHRASCFRICGLVEKPSLDNAPSNIGVVGRYLLEPCIFHYLEEQVLGSNGELELTDSLDKMSREQSVFGLQIQGDHFDAGDHIGFIKASITLSLRDPASSGYLKDFLTELLKNNSMN